MFDDEEDEGFEDCPNDEEALEEFLETCVALPGRGLGGPKLMLMY